MRNVPVWVWVGLGVVILVLCCYISYIWGRYDQCREDRKYLK